MIMGELPRVDKRMLRLKLDMGFVKKLLYVKEIFTKPRGRPASVIFRVFGN